MAHFILASIVTFLSFLFFLIELENGRFLGGYTAFFAVGLRSPFESGLARRRRRLGDDLRGSGGVQGPQGATHLKGKKEGQLVMKVTVLFQTASL